MGLHVELIPQIDLHPQICPGVWTKRSLLTLVCGVHRYMYVGLSEVDFKVKTYHATSATVESLQFLPAVFQNAVGKIK